MRLTPTIKKILLRTTFAVFLLIAIGGSIHLFMNSNGKTPEIPHKAKEDQNHPPAIEGPEVLIDPKDGSILAPPKPSTKYPFGDFTDYELEAGKNPFDLEKHR